MARSGFTGLVVQIDGWQLNSPSGSEVVGDHVLVGASGSGAFSGQSNNLAYCVAAATFRFIAATALRGVWLFRKSSNVMYHHDGTNPVGPIAAGALLAANNLSDVANVGTAQGNLDVYSTSGVDALLDDKLDATKLEDGTEDGQLARWDAGDAKWVPLAGPSGANGTYTMKLDRASSVNGIPYWAGP